MVKVLFLGFLVAMMCGLGSAVPAPQLTRSIRTEVLASPSPPVPSSPILEDPATRSERSTNLSYITGTARKIQLFIKNRHLQLLPDGTVNGTLDASSAYTILQRMTVGVGKMKIQGVATCQHLCMDSCGLLYGSRVFGDECVFNEMIEHDHYNTYSSTRYSNERRTLYLALNRRGQPRKVLLRAHQQLGRLASYTRVLTRPVTPERVEGLIHPLRHHAHICGGTAAESSSGRLPDLTSSPSSNDQVGQHQLRCRRRKKKKKKKRKCPHGAADDENDDENAAPCLKKQSKTNKKHSRFNNNNKKCESVNSEECQRVNNNNKKKQKNPKFGNKQQLNNGGNKKNKKKTPKGALGKNKKARLLTTVATTTTEPPIMMTTTDDVSGHFDDDYTVDNSTHWTDWDEATSTVMMASDEYGTTPTPSASLRQHPD